MIICWVGVCHEQSTKTTKHAKNTKNTFYWFLVIFVFFVGLVPVPDIQQGPQLAQRLDDRHVGRAAHRQLERATSTPRMPRRRAPSMSCRKLSPTITASAGVTSARRSAA